MMGTRTRAEWRAAAMDISGAARVACSASRDASQYTAVTKPDVSCAVLFHGTQRPGGCRHGPHDPCPNHRRLP